LTWISRFKRFFWQEAESVKMQALKLGHLQSNAKHLAEKNDFAAAAKVIDEMISAGGGLLFFFCVFVSFVFIFECRKPRFSRLGKVSPRICCRAVLRCGC
jgi:hypothetical protein